MIKKKMIKIKNNLKKLNKNIKVSKSKCNKLYIVLLLDIILCKIMYMINSYEYTLYEFYNITHLKRKTYFSSYKYKLKNKLYDNKSIDSIINNKSKLCIRFKDYLKREVYNINDLSYKEFENIILENKKIICRSNKSSFIDSYKVYDLNDYRGPGFVLEEIKKNNLLLIEKSFNQNKTLNKLSPLVIINVSLLLDEVLCLTASFKENGKIVKCFIDSETFNIKGNFRVNNKIYNEKCISLKVPYLKDIINLSKEMSMKLNSKKELKWSYSIDENGNISFVDIDDFDDYEFIQIPEYLKNNIGFLPKYKKAMSKVKH